MNPFKKYFWNVITKQYIDFKGRASRTEFWMFVFFSLLLSTIIFSAIYIGLNSSFSKPKIEIENNVSSSFTFLSTLIILIIVYTFFLFLPSLAISVRRLHDAGFSGWFLLLNFIPTIGSIIIFILFLLPSQNGKNKYDVEYNKNTSTPDIELIDKLYSLKEKGVISQEEFEKKKSESLNI